MKHVKTIRWQLFFSYAGIITVVVVTLASVVYIYVSRILKKNASEALQTVASNINISLDAEFREMNEEADHMISSRPIKDIFYSSDFSKDNDVTTRAYLFNLLFTASGTSMNNKIYIMGNNGRLIQYGQQFDITQQKLDTIFPRKLFERCLEQNGLMDISSVHTDKSGNRVISLSRAFNASFGAPYDSIVEVQADYQRFERLIISAVSSVQNAHPYVYNIYGEQIYPAQSQKQYYDVVKSHSGFGTIYLNTEKENKILSYTRSSQTGWMVVAEESENELMHPVSLFRNIVFFAVLLTLLITLMITSFVSHKLTQPIQRIRESISRLNLKSLSNQTLPLGRPFSCELEMLYEAYEEMVDRLQTSLDEVVSIRSHEIRARMLALQAQMNPHFLYNTVANISALADMNHEPEIVRMCESLSGMLRYITKGTAGHATVEEEINYMQQYLLLMKYRYPHQIEVSVSIPQKLLCVRVPKLVIQPIVENCFKYAFITRPPWKIAIKGELNEDRWLISVTNNGVGFEPSTLNWLKEKMGKESFNFANEDGKKTGLLNIFYRLKILYHEDAVFQITNNANEGSTVVIGGLVESDLLD